MLIASDFLSWKTAASRALRLCVVVLAGFVVWLVARRAIGSRLSVLLVSLLVGCGERPAATEIVAPPNAVTRPSVALRVLVVNDAALAAAINRLRGEWTEREDGTLAAESKPWGDIQSSKAIDADLIVFSARYLGELAERVRPIRERVAKGELYDADDVLPLARDKLAMYGGRLLAFPIGVQVPLVSYRDDWLQRGGDNPPTTWHEYRELVERVGEAPPMWPPRDSIEHWPAIMLLARAAAYACHPRQESPLFDPQTMQPRIADPPFEKALHQWRQELIIAAQRQNSNQASATDGSPAAGDFRWAELPAADQVFNRSTGQWETTRSEPRRVPLLADGLLVAVTTSSRNAASAFELAAWLASSEIASQLFPSSTPLLPCRQSHLASAGSWTEPSTGFSGDSNIADLLEIVLSRDACFIVPRTPGVDEYLAQLADGVSAALRGDLSASDALERVAERWNKITDRLGRDVQRRAYHEHLGLTTP
jgi:multiple sugar transport system substrate-binding protein